MSIPVGIRLQMPFAPIYGVVPMITCAFLSPLRQPSIYVVPHLDLLRFFIISLCLFDGITHLAQLESARARCVINSHLRHSIAGRRAAGLAGSCNALPSLESFLLFPSESLLTWDQGVRKARPSTSALPRQARSYLHRKEVTCPLISSGS